jgi:hypothetical protein
MNEVIEIFKEDQLMRFKFFTSQLAKNNIYQINDLYLIDNKKYQLYIGEPDGDVFDIDEDGRYVLLKAI